MKVLGSLAPNGIHAKPAGKSNPIQRRAVDVGEIAGPRPGILSRKALVLNPKDALLAIRVNDRDDIQTLTSLGPKRLNV
jgi:hypothetical protein